MIPETENSKFIRMANGGGDTINLQHVVMVKFRGGEPGTPNVAHVFFSNGHSVVYENSDDALQLMRALERYTVWVQPGAARPLSGHEVMPTFEQVMAEQWPDP